MKMNTDRELALSWWRGLSRQEQFEHATAWQDRLPENDFKRFWTLEMMISSSLCIEQMFNKHLTPTSD